MKMEKRAEEIYIPKYNRRQMTPGLYMHFIAFKTRIWTLEKICFVELKCSLN